MAPVQVDLHPNQSAASHCREKRLLSLQQAAYLLRLPDIVIIASFRALRCGNCCLTWAIDLLLLLPQFVLLLPCYHVCSTDVSAALHRHHPRSGSGESDKQNGAWQQGTLKCSAAYCCGHPHLARRYFNRSSFHSTPCHHTCTAGYTT